MYTYRCLAHNFVCSSANSDYKGMFIGLADILLFLANNHTLYFPALPKQLSQHNLVPRASWFLSLFLTIACTFDVILLDITKLMPSKFGHGSLL